MLLVFLLFLCAVQPVISSKILYINPVNSSSHRMWNNFLVKELAKRGHQITYIVPYLHLNDELHPNINLAFLNRSDRIREMWKDAVSCSFIGTSTEILTKFNEVPLYDCEEMLEKGIMKNLISLSNQDSYDLIMLEHFGHDCLFGLTYRFGAPMILLSPFSYNPHWLQRIVGVPMFHAAPHSALQVKPPYGFWKRIKFLEDYLFNDYDYFTRIRPSMEKIAKKHFGQNVWPMKKLIENVAVSIINVPPWTNKIPLPANVIPIAGIHLVEAQPLNPTLGEFVNGAEDGIIFISFGNILPTQYIANNIFKAIASAVGKLPQRVLWKWDSSMNDNNITFPKNIRRASWFPQNDILGHPKMRLFVSHCGGQSTLEAAYHGTPILAVPGFWDQSENANRMIAEEAGIRLDIEDITEKTFFEATTEILTDPKKVF